MFKKIFIYILSICYVCVKHYYHCHLKNCTVTSLDVNFRYLDSYIKQKKFMPFVPEISAEFSAPPEFPAMFWKKTDLSTTFDLQITNQILCHCILIQKSLWHLLWDFPIVSLVTGRRIFRPQDFPAVSVFTGWDFPDVSAVTGRMIFRRYL